MPEAFYQLINAWITVRLLHPKKYLSKIEPSNSAFNTHINIKKSKLIAGVINGIAARTPWTSTCLIKAVAADRMLQKRGIRHQLHFGVNKGKGKTLEAHAWLSVEGEVIVGGENHESFEEVKKINN